MLRRFFATFASLCLMFGIAAIGPAPTITHGQEVAADEVAADTVEPASEEAISEKTDENPEETGEPSVPTLENAGAVQGGEKADPATDEPAEGKDTEGSEAKQESGEKIDGETKTNEPSTEDQEQKESNKKAKGKSEKTEDPKPKVSEPKRLPRLGATNGPMLPGQQWRVHDMRRPRPPVVTPGELSTYEKPGTAPSDAVVLFDGTNLNEWCHVSRDDPNQLLEAQWKVEDGYFEVTSGTGNLQTIDNFGSCQLHLEWQAPAKVRGDSQGRGNSGVFFMDEFEVQVLDSYQNRTYADGQAGALYGQYSPMVNASRKPGEWQIYDIIFEAPKFTLEGELEEPASITVMHNGIFLHHAKKYYGPTGGGVVPRYDPLAPAGPIRIQEHGNPVRFRNIWLRPLN